ncbi:MAG TPA: Fe(2+)-trafficking protein [Candidatus Saccharimonadales bacterium]|nr:Fe(2+)-trafficking protein [Candidatus Saccharimonadales bacterium]
MADLVTCSRCTNERPALPKPPWPDALGRTIQEKVCSGCWSDWLATQIKIINEYHINVGEPAGQKVLMEQMRAFLNLPE